MPAVHRGRRGQAAAGARQPARQRGEVHRAGRRRARGSRSRRGEGGDRAPSSRSRTPGPGIAARRARRALPALRAGARRASRRAAARGSASRSAASSRGSWAATSRSRAASARGACSGSRSPSRPRARLLAGEPRAPRSGRVVGIVGDGAAAAHPDRRRRPRTTGAGCASCSRRSASTCARRQNGAEALAVFDAWAPHVVLMDLHMPMMDGFAAMRAIRARPGGPGGGHRRGHGQRLRRRARRDLRGRRRRVAAQAVPRGAAPRGDREAPRRPVPVRHALRALPVPLAADARRAARSWRRALGGADRGLRTAARIADHDRLVAARRRDPARAQSPSARSCGRFSGATRTTRSSAASTSRERARGPAPSRDSMTSGTRQDGPTWRSRCID